MFWKVSLLPTSDPLRWPVATVDGDRGGRRKKIWAPPWLQTPSQQNFFGPTMLYEVPTIPQEVTTMLSEGPTN